MSKLGFPYFQQKLSIPEYVELFTIGPKVHNIKHICNLVEHRVYKPYLLICSPNEAPQLFLYQKILEASKKNKFIKEVVVIDGGTDPIPGVKTFNFPGFFQNYNQENRIVGLSNRNYIFCMTVRWPRLQRVMLMKELLKRNLTKYGLISFGLTDKPDNFNQDLYPSTLMNLFTAEEKSFFPFVIDQEIVEEVNEEEGWNITQWHANPIYKLTNYSLFNVVCETSFDTTESTTHPGMYFNSRYCHNRRFITEKTMMAVYNRQVPIILSVTNTVEYLRNIGLDMFDDIVDHSYDLEKDPEKRIKMVADQIEKVCKLNILKEHPNLKYRLDRNVQIGSNFFNTFKDTFFNSVEDYLEDIKSLF